MQRAGLGWGRIVGAIVAGALAEAAVTVFSSWFQNANGGYGAPFEVGQTSGFLLFSDRPTTFSPLIFALDVVVAAVLFLVLARWSGWLGVLLGTLGALASLALVVVMGGYGLPFAGLPIPLFLSNPLPVSLVLWVDMFFWAAVELSCCALRLGAAHRRAAAGGHAPVRVGRIVAALAGALVLQILLSGFTSALPGDRGAYGAPLSVGYSCGLCGLISLGGGHAGDTFSWSIFVLNVLATVGVYWLLLRLGGHALLVPLGGVLFLVLAVAMYVAVDAGLPFAGLPVPIATHPGQRMALLALWIDCLSGAALFGAPGLLRARRDERERRASRDRGLLDRSP